MILLLPISVAKLKAVYPHLLVPSVEGQGPAVKGWVAVTRSPVRMERPVLHMKHAQEIGSRSMDAVFTIVCG